MPGLRAFAGQVAGPGGEEHKIFGAGRSGAAVGLGGVCPEAARPRKMNAMGSKAERVERMAASSFCMARILPSCEWKVTRNREQFEQVQH